MPDSRPDPADLLARIQREEGRIGSSADGVSSVRGRLKVFFGMAPGVGKTYAMLTVAQRLAGRGVDVVVGVVETHGRAETEQMLLGLDILPRRKIDYRGSDGSSSPVVLEEFDVDAAIARHPDVLLVDELAHTNAPGSERAKRWQDVQVCLKAGINVYTTLNVQHLESINDIVAQITGVPVRETVPDAVFDEADEVELVDLTPDVLHERLKAGKVYLGDNAARAVDAADGFFRKGNLTALRELALRRTAAWVDSELRRYKQDRGIRAVWPASERILVAVSPSPMSGNLVRAAKRMAAGLHADMIAAYVEPPQGSDLSPADRERLNLNLRLAESLGASTTVVAGANPARELIALARARNVTRVVVGKSTRSRWRDAIFGSFIDRLIRESGDVDIYVVRGDDADDSSAVAVAQRDTSGRSGAPGTRRELVPYLARFGASTLIVAASAGLAWTFYAPPDLSEESMLLLAGVVLCALWFGRGPAILASVLAVLAFNFLFTAPRFSFSVNDSNYLVTFAVMLVSALIVGTLAARTRENARSAHDRERRTAALYELSRELARAREAHEVARIAVRHAHDTLGIPSILAVPGRSLGEESARSLDVLASAGAPDWFDDRERGVAQWAIDHGSPSGAGTQRLPASKGRYIPLIGTSGRLGLLGLCLARDDAQPVASFGSGAMLVMDALCNQITSALERVSLSEFQQAARLEAERERLRSALLSSVSHDLRTPLASITGAASALEQAWSGSTVTGASLPIDATTQASLLRTIVDESSRLNDIIANLVFATRLESGAVSLRRDWTTVEEIVGVGLARHRDELAQRPFQVQLPNDLPMLRVDNAMLPQVIHNLIENSLRYTPAGTAISIAAWATEGQVVVKVSDLGPGLADDESSKVFQRFYRGRAAKLPTSPAGRLASSSGMGLGLTICEGVVRVHGGRIWAEPNTPRGVAFLFSIPIEFPQPTLPKEQGRESSMPDHKTGVSS